MTTPTTGDPIPTPPTASGGTDTGDPQTAEPKRRWPSRPLLLLLVAAGLGVVFSNTRPQPKQPTLPHTAVPATPQPTVHLIPTTSIDSEVQKLIGDYLTQIGDAEAIDAPARVDAIVFRALSEPNNSGVFWAAIAQHYRQHLASRSLTGDERAAKAIPLAALFGNAFRYSKNEPAVLRACADYLLATGRQKEARPILEQLVIIAPSDARLHIQLAESQRATGQFSKASKSLNTYLDLNPDDEQASTTLATILLEQLVDYPAALEFCQTAKERFPQNRYLRYAHAQALVGNFRADEALAALKELAVTAPYYDTAVTGDLEFRSFLGMAQQKSGSSYAAETSYRKAIAVAPVSATDAYNNLALLQLETAPPTKETLELARKAVELKRDNPRYRSTLGQCLLKLGRYSEALTEFIQVRTLEKKPNAQTLKQLGDAYEKMGRLTQARTAWSQASKLAPDDPELTSRVTRSTNY